MRTIEHNFLHCEHGFLVTQQFGIINKAAAFKIDHFIYFLSELFRSFFCIALLVLNQDDITYVSIIYFLTLGSITLYWHLDSMEVKVMGHRSLLTFGNGLLAGGDDLTYFPEIWHLMNRGR